MFTPRLDKNSDQPKYEQLYRFIKEAVISGGLSEGDRLPSKRKLAAHLRIGVNTVENAYAQLMAEGYIEALEKKGYFVQKVESQLQAAVSPPRILKLEKDKPPQECPFDLKSNAVDVASFPFSIWSTLMREVLRKNRASLLNEIPPLGDMGLRLEIVRYLRDFRGLSASPEQVMLGTGTAHLLGILAGLLPRHAFAVENPGYLAASRGLSSLGSKVIGLALDHEGLRLDQLRESGAEAVFITPSHHFPLGTVMSINRRMQILKWAGERPNRYVIEDDYDSEYRYAGKPVPPLYSLGTQKVIYLNTFTRTLAPSLRMAYMVLPAALLNLYYQRFGFHASSVSGFEQNTLALFMGRGFYERHLSRMRNIYKKRQNILLNGLIPLADSISISGGEAGLHLLIRSNSGLTEKEMIRKARRAGVRVYGLSGCCLKRPPETHTVMAGYGGPAPAELAEAAALLSDCWK